MTAATTTRLVDGLVALRLVDRAIDALDRRARRVRLTDEGRALVTTVLPRLGQRSVRLVENLGGAEAARSLARQLEAAAEDTDD